MAIVTPRAIKKAVDTANADLPLLAGKFVAKVETSMGTPVAFTLAFEPPAPPLGPDLSCVDCGCHAHPIAGCPRRGRD